MDAGEAAIDAAIQRTSFETLKAAERQGGFKERPPMTKDFFRSGRKDEWKEQLSEAQIAHIVRANAQQMQRFGYWEPAFEQWHPQGARAAAALPYTQHDGAE